jgi:hypothetical protein
MGLSFNPENRALGIQQENQPFPQAQQMGRGLGI